jgi:hypothetical protein
MKKIKKKINHLKCIYKLLIEEEIILGCCLKPQLSLKKGK